MVHLATAGYALTLLQPAQATHFTVVQTLLQTGLRNLEQWELLALAASAAVTWAAWAVRMAASAVADDKILHIYSPYFLLANPSPICYNSFMFTLLI